MSFLMVTSRVTYKTLLGNIQKSLKKFKFVMSFYNHTSQYQNYLRREKSRLTFNGKINNSLVIRSLSYIRSKSYLTLLFITTNNTIFLHIFHSLETLRIPRVRGQMN